MKNFWCLWCAVIWVMLLALCIVSGVCRGGDREDIEAAIAVQIQLAKLSAEPVNPPEVKPQEAKPLTYTEARQLAIKTGKPLVVWIGSAICPACIQATKDEFVNYVAASDSRFPPDSLTVAVRDGTELLMAGQTKRWDGNHLPTIRKMLRLWDGQTGKRQTITDAVLWPAEPLLPMIQRPPMMQTWSAGTVRFSSVVCST